MKLLQHLPLLCVVLFICSCVSFRARTPDDAHDMYHVVDGHRMHISVQGEGVPVVFSAGAGVKDPRAGFSAVTALLSTRAMAVVFDRPGFGKSDSTTAPRDADTMARELDELLREAGIAFPIVLVGHSIGSFDVLRYAQMYPAKVRAVVLLDGTPPAWVLDTFGGPPKTLVDYVARGLAPRDLLDEMLAYKANARRIAEAGSIGEIPLTHLYASTRDEDWNRYQALYEQMSLQPRGVPTNDAEHYIHKQVPQLVVDEIVRLLAPTPAG